MTQSKETSRVWGLVLGALVVASSLVYVACDGSSDNAIKEKNPTRDSGTLPDGAPIPEGGVLPDGAIPDGGDCFVNPKTHFEIINACTTAQKREKNPTLPLLLSDGGLPPLN